MAQSLAALNEAIGKLVDAMDEEVKQYPYVGNFERILPKNAAYAAAELGFAPADNPPIDARGETVFYNSVKGQYIVRASDVRTPGVWEVFDKQGNRLGFYDQTLTTWFPDPPLNPGFTWAQPRPRTTAPEILEAKALTPDEKAKQVAAQKAREKAALEQGGVTTEGEPPQDDNSNDDEEDETAEDKAAPPDASRPWRESKKLSPAEADARAKELGYERTNNYDFDSRGQPVYWDRKTKTYISPTRICMPSERGRSSIDVAIGWAPMTTTSFASRSRVKDPR